MHKKICVGIENTIAQFSITRTHWTRVNIFWILVNNITIDNSKEQSHSSETHHSMLNDKSVSSLHRQNVVWH
ncbi:hypothetical protein BLOT_000009 [Blomia tropicalis]|nr:hypothetical protein BLOT_000009 [Blomia tropicalis]